jgi:hypothetical protein
MATKGRKVGQGARGTALAAQGQLAADLLREAHAQVRSTARASSVLFPYGITKIALELGVSAQELARFALTIQGPDSGTVIERADEASTRQMTPTASWWFKTDGGSGLKEALGAISLGSETIATENTPWFGWNASSEHWFTKNADVRDSLDIPIGNPMTFVGLDHDAAQPEAPTKSLKETANAWALDWADRFLGKPRLNDGGTSHWLSGSPPGAPSGGYYFEDLTHDPKIRVYFRTNQSGLLTSITWFADEEYDGFAPDGTAITLTRKATPPSWPGTAWYYRCPT